LALLTKRKSNDPVNQQVTGVLRGTAMIQADKTVPDCLKLGEWEFHVRSHELSRNGKTIRLEPRVASLLLYLAAHPGEPTSRTSLLEALWPGVVVSDEVLTNAVNKLRRAFGDDRTHPKVIETIPKAGYRLLLPVQAQASVTPTPPPSTGSQPASRAGKSRRRWPCCHSTILARNRTRYILPTA
jgi:DNA-binding winged helix-turn-helix (wHTH) protein